MSGKSGLTWDLNGGTSSGAGFHPISEKCLVDKFLFLLSDFNKRVHFFDRGITNSRTNYVEEANDFF